LPGVAFHCAKGRNKKRCAAGVLVWQPAERCRQLFKAWKQQTDFYTIYQTTYEIDEKAIVKLLKEAAKLDESFSKRK
jgi:hypothetical protein